jgi:hypothetical protein
MREVSQFPTAPRMQPTAAEDGRVGDAGSVANATAQMQQRAERGLGALRGLEEAGSISDFDKRPHPCDPRRAARD